MRESIVSSLQSRSHGDLADHDLRDRAHLGMPQEMTQVSAQFGAEVAYITARCYPIELLKEAGVDMTTDEPLDLTVKSMARVVDEMEAILARRR
jgi:oligoendopeptidase F